MTLTMVNFPSTPPRTTEPVYVTPEHPFGLRVLFTPPGQINPALHPLGSPLTGPPSNAPRQQRVGVRPGIGQDARRQLDFG